MVDKEDTPTPSTPPTPLVNQSPTVEGAHFGMSAPDSIPINYGKVTIRALTTLYLNGEEFGVNDAPRETYDTPEVRGAIEAGFAVAVEGKAKGKADKADKDAAKASK